MVIRALQKILEERLRKQNPDLDNAPSYRDLSDEEQKIVRNIYLENHLKDDKGHGIREVVEGLERNAMRYNGQKSLFESVLRGGFESVQGVERQYPGGIAILTINGTFAMLGDLDEDGLRLLNMTRICKPEYNKYNGKRFFLESDPMVGMGTGLRSAVSLSPSRYLAIKGNDASETVIGRDVGDTSFS